MTNTPISAETFETDKIEWKQLWSLAALYGSIVIGWIAYHNYQPKLLVQFNYTQYSFWLIVVQGIILFLTPPIAGKIGDRFRFKAGHRIPIISSGISLAAMVFMAVAFTLLSNPGEVIQMDFTAVDCSVANCHEYLHQPGPLNLRAFHTH
jgi:MFS family permease